MWTASAKQSKVTKPGGLVEWTASDGRKGKLTGSGRQRLTAASLTKVPSAKDAAHTNTASSSSIGGMFGLFDDASFTGSNDKRVNASSWSKQQDARLMELKADNEAWIKISQEVGKDLQKCKQRFKEIKPKNWKPNSAKQGNHRGGGAGHEKRRQNNFNNQSNTTNRQRGRKTSANEPNKLWCADNNTSGNSRANTGHNGWGGVNTSWNDVGNENNMKDGTAGAAWGDAAWPADSANDNSGAWNTAGEAGDGAAGGTWDTMGGDATAGAWDTTGGNATTGAWDTAAGAGEKTNGFGNNTANAWGATSATGIGATSGQDNNVNAGGAFDTWNSGGNAWPAQPSVKAASKAPTVKAGFHHNPTYNVIAAPLELEIRPDNTFSADDLRIVARILQQDCSLVWDRVSWRFRDKTGRTLHPDIFERKITGRVEGEKRRK